MYKRILCPYDGSATAERGLAEAINLAREQNAQLIILNVVEEFAVLQAGGFEGGGLYSGEILDSMVADGKQIAARAADLARNGGVDAESVSVVSPSSRSSECIVDEAKSRRADLIVMGTHGRRGFNRLVLGSDAEIVVRTAPAPVLLVRDPGEEAKK